MPNDDTDRTLDLIDGALDDYLSPDAMRWSPEPDAGIPEFLTATGGWRAPSTEIVGRGFTADLVILDEAAPEFPCVTARRGGIVYPATAVRITPLNEQGEPTGPSQQISVRNFM